MMFSSTVIQQKSCALFPRYNSAKQQVSVSSQRPSSPVRGSAPEKERYRAIHLLHMGFSVFSTPYQGSCKILCGGLCIYNYTNINILNMQYECIHIDIYIYTYISVCVSKKQININEYIYIYTYMCVIYIYIYIVYTH